MQSSVLIIGPQFHYFNQSVRHAFEALGWRAVVCAYDNPIHPYNSVNRVRYKFAADKSLLREQSRRRFRPEIERMFQEQHPDLVFIINSDNLLPETIARFAKDAKVVIWLFDSIRRMPSAMENLRQAHAVYCYEQDDIAFLHQQTGIVAHFLPQAADLRLYHPLADVRKDLDIVFAGDIYRSPKRQQLLQHVVTHFHDRRLLIHGVCAPWFKNPVRWIMRPSRGVYTNHNAGFEQLCADYNRARVVLNIHVEQQTNGANPKVYEIAAAGAYQVCDANSYVTSVFTDGMIGFYHDETELIDRLEAALAVSHERQAWQAHQQVVMHDTFIDRMQQVLGDIYHTAFPVVSLTGIEQAVLTNARKQL